MSFIEVEEDQKPKESTADKAANSLWVEKYRPNTLSEYVGNESLKAKVEQYLKEGIIPHLLLYGSAGTGKTSLAKLIVKSIKCDKLYINASDENNVDTVRNKIKSFASSMGFNDLKVIILDEADYLTPNAQAALRNLMETYSATTRFILTCNYKERMLEPILSRSQPYEIIPPNRKEVALLAHRILEAEGVTYDRLDLKAIMDAQYPDVRAVINTCQRSIINGRLVLDKAAVIDGDIKSKVIDMLKNKNRKEAFNQIRQHLADSSVRDYAGFYALLYEKSVEICPENEAEFIAEINDGQIKDGQVIDKELNFMATIARLQRVIFKKAS